MKYSHFSLGFLSLVLLLCWSYFQRSYRKSNEEYDKLGPRPLIDPTVLAERIEFYRTGAIVVLFLCPFPIAFILHMERVAPIFLLKMKLSLSVVIAIFLVAAKLWLRVPFSGLWSAPLSWKKQISALFLGLCTASLISSAVTLLTDSTMRDQLVNTLFKPGG